MVGVFPLEVVLVAVVVLDELAVALLTGGISKEEDVTAGLKPMSAEDAASSILEDDATGVSMVGASVLLSSMLVSAAASLLAASPSPVGACTPAESSEQAASRQNARIEDNVNFF